MKGWKWAYGHLQHISMKRLKKVTALAIDFMFFSEICQNLDENGKMSRKERKKINNSFSFLKNSTQGAMTATCAD